MLDEKIKRLQGGGGGMGAGNGGGGLGAGVSEDLEAEVAKLREDLDNHKSAYDRDQAKIIGELSTKVG